MVSVLLRAAIAVIRLRQRPTAKQARALSCGVLRSEQGPDRRRGVLDIAQVIRLPVICTVALFAMSLSFVFSE